MRIWLRMLAPVLASIVGLASLRLLGPDILDQESLRRFLAPMGVWAPVVFILLLTIRPLTLLPGQIFAAVGGLLFGVVLGTVYSLVGSMLAVWVVFALSKRFGTGIMRRFAGHRYDALRITARRHDFKVAVLVAINPLLPTDMQIAVAGASGARFWPTAAGVLVGIIPGTILTAQFGSALGTGRTILTIVSAVGMVVSMVLGVLLGRRVMSDFGDAQEAIRENGGTPPPSGKGSRKLAAGTP